MMPNDKPLDDMERARLDQLRQFGDKKMSPTERNERTNLAARERLAPQPSHGDQRPPAAGVDMDAPLSSAERAGENLAAREHIAAENQRVDTRDFPIFPPMEPLSPAEVGHLAELRALPEHLPEHTKEMADLSARENVPPAPLPPEKPDPELVEGFVREGATHLVGLVESIIATLPQLAGLAPRAALMRAAYDRAVFHSLPAVDVEEPPEPSQAEKMASMTPRERRIAELRDRPDPSEAEKTELRALMSEHG